MTNQVDEKRTFSSELRSLVLTAQCLAEYAAEQGDKQSAAILDNVAALLDMAVLSPIGNSALTVELSRKRLSV